MSRVNDLCLEVWRAREAMTLTHDMRGLGRRLYAAVADDMAASDGYEPDEDRRVDWLHQVIRARRGMSGPPRLLRPLADADLEALIKWMLFGAQRELCGKDLAAGCDR